MKRYIRAAIKDLSNMSEYEKFAIIQDSSANPELRNALLSDLSWLDTMPIEDADRALAFVSNLCMQLCEIPNVPPASLVHLFSVYDENALLQHPNFPIDILTLLAKEHYDDNEDYYSYFIACNPNATSEILSLLAGSPSTDVRELVAEHPNTDTDTLQELLSDEEDCVSDAAISNLKKRGEVW